ncbi:MAG TPA: 30S ribosomal protein S6 [Candidatus Fimenecus excrementavium]|nr:30S ribosomal protein S6 [Candidatus Fimenecus excrementavium]
MSKYEAVVVLSVKNGDEATQSLVAKFKALVEANGTLESVDEWGKRKLAYEIDDEAEGYYVLFNFESEPAFPAEFERIANITDGVLRSLVVKQ